MDDQIRKTLQLEKLNAKWTQECQCELKKTATQAVPGSGNANARIVFIGEAPGKNEDKTGIPFVGAAGKFLDQMLTSVALKREDIYITSVVKYRPPNNRDPKPEEVEACRPWLEDQLQIISPILIIFLGRYAMHNFFPDLDISKVHGKLLTKKFKNIKTKYFLPLYHPAASIYRGSLRTTLLKDFKKIPKVLKGIAKCEENKI